MQYKVPLVQCTVTSGYFSFIHLGGLVVVRLLLLNLQPDNFSAYLLRSSKLANSSSTTAGLEPEFEPVTDAEDSDSEVVSPEPSDSDSEGANPTPSEDSSLAELDDAETSAS